MRLFFNESTLNSKRTYWGFESRKRTLSKRTLQSVWEQLADKPREEITEEYVSEVVTNMIKSKTDLDGVGATMFQKLMLRILKKSQKK
jgi:hypothetical protein